MLVTIWPSEDVEIVTNVVCDVELARSAEVTVVLLVLLVLESEVVDGAEEDVVLELVSELGVDDDAALDSIEVVVTEVVGGVVVAESVGLVVVDVSVSVVEVCAVDVFELPVPRLWRLLNAPFLRSSSPARTAIVRNNIASTRRSLNQSGPIWMVSVYVTMGVDGFIEEMCPASELRGRVIFGRRIKEKRRW